MHKIYIDTFKFVHYKFKNIRLNLFSKKKKFLKLYIQKTCFANLHIFFLKATPNTKFLYNIMFTFFRSYWYLFISLQNRLNYYNLLKNIFKKFFLLKNKNLSNYLIINKNINTIYPNSILIDINFNYSTIKTLNLQLLNNFEKYFSKKLLTGGIIKNKYLLNSILYKKNDYSNTKFNLNFLRIQRRYNKRRYSKVRVTSRNSFFGGITLSSIFLAILWGGSIKNIDWISSYIIIIDVNLILFLLIAYFLFRIYIIHNPTIFIRKKNKIKILYNIHKLFLLNFINKNK